MLEGFENITYDLTEKEKELIPVFIRGFKNKIGKDKAVTSFQIIERLKGHDLSGPRVRKIINYIRNNYLLPGLIATSDGYYISRDPAEVKNYINSLVHREKAIQNIRLKMEEYCCSLK